MGALGVRKGLSWLEKALPCITCIFEHITCLINWSGKAHWDFGSRSGPINESSIPERARMSSSHIAANKPCHSFWVFRDRYMRVELSILFLGGIGITY